MSGEDVSAETVGDVDVFRELIAPSYKLALDDMLDEMASQMAQTVIVCGLASITPEDRRELEQVVSDAMLNVYDGATDMGLLGGEIALIVQFGHGVEFDTFHGVLSVTDGWYTNVRYVDESVRDWFSGLAWRKLMSQPGESVAADPRHKLDSGMFSDKPVETTVNNNNNAKVSE